MSIVLTTTITIDATTDEVWQVLTDFASYGQWSNFSRVDGVAETGTPLSMKMPGFAFTSTVTAVAPAETPLPVIGVVSLLCLTALGALGGHLGGAPKGRAAVRVAIGGALAMGLTAGIGRLLGVAVG